MEPEPVIFREEVIGTMFTLADIAAGVETIVRLLQEDEDGEEGPPQDDA
ncbi:MAG TPA: hypothetical protein VLB86_12610 [Gaiellaceae bacterium]|nr:hypothetical protein [Gaiellaceae bacterium]